MIGKFETYEKGSTLAARLITKFFVVVVAVLLATSFTGAAFARGGLQTERGSLKGEIVTIDHANNLKTVTLRSSQVGQFPNDELNIFLTKDTKIKVCNSLEPFKDMRVDHSATVTYHELGGMAVADSISERC